jgi:hypothetical protein
MGRGTIWMLLGALAVLGTAVPASAQVTRVRGGEFRRQEVRDETLLRAGRMEAGFVLAASYAYNRVSPEGVDAVSQHTVYLVPAVMGGYMVLDWLEVRATLGLQYIGTSVEAQDTQDDFSGVLTVQALAQADFGLGVGGYVGLGAGGYYGWRNAPVPGTPGVSYRYDHGGGVGQAMLGLIVQPGASLMFRGGLRLDLLFGGEWPADDSLGLSSAGTFNANVVADLSISWRFGG